MYIQILKIIFSIFCYDIWFYISHLILHHEYVYKYHKKHHKKINNMWNKDYKKQGYIFATRENIFNNVVKILNKILI